MKRNNFYNVFVLCAGRCGSLTFSKATSYIKNYTSSHESLASAVGTQRFDYPKNHIEIDNRLSWMLGRLDSAFGDAPFYVHLKRSNLTTAESFLKRFDRGIMGAYHSNIIMSGLRKNPQISKLDFCLDLVETINSNIELFLKQKTNKITINLEEIEEQFPAFWKSIDADGDLNSALSEFNTCYNASK